MSITRRLFGIVAAGFAVAVTDARNGVMAMSTNLELFKAIVERGAAPADRRCGLTKLRSRLAVQLDLSRLQFYDRLPQALLRERVEPVCQNALISVDLQL